MIFVNFATSPISLAMHILRTALRTLALMLIVGNPAFESKAENNFDIELDSLRDSILSNINGASIVSDNAASTYNINGKKIQSINILSLGAKGNGKKDCRPAFDKAMRRADKNGGLHITVPAGDYFIKGPVTLARNVCIELQKGATLRFTPDPECYPIVNTSWEGTFIYNYSPMIYGYGLTNVAIIGEGTIDGNAMDTFATWRRLQKPAQKRTRDMNHSRTDIEERRFGKGDYLRPQLLQLYNCTGVTLQGVKIINSPFWCVHLLKSEDIICRGLRYDAKLVNNDGIDPECSRNILIEDIDFDNGDDNIAIKSGRDDDGRSANSPSENIVIRNCRFKGLHAVVIGSEMSSGVRNVIIEDCTYAGYCKRGIYVKTNPDRGGFVRNLFVRNCTFGDVEDLFYVTSCYAGEGMDNHYFSTIENIHVDGLKCGNASAAALVVQGTKQKPVRNVTFSNIEVGSAKIGVSFSDTEGVTLNDCFIGGRVGVPTQAAKSDRIFDRDKKQ